ncbi:hypothetical protein [Anaerobium acetethylicum]|uniref:Uncharacterized protein n=1 Tax=Anaerobium acetethylicum TaxID=1619234 RepID=A0A1D3TPM7_9FIRM|nr:hypothetical protein [Anaerobium acetethylicum]SCP95368.1 hypothetical protein SAMN05421730_1001511 [Anaerobium acetethylicum]
MAAGEVANNYDITLDRAFALCMRGDIESAVAEARVVLKEFGWIERAAHLLLCIYSITGKDNDAGELLHSMQADGIWLNPGELECDTDLDSLRGWPEFRSLVEFSKREYERLSKDVKCELIPVQNGTEGKEALYFVHGRGTSFAEFTGEFAECFMDQKLFFIQSSQVYAKDRYCWDDEEKAIEQITAVLKSCKTNKRYICGISQGGRILVQALLQNKINDDIYLLIPAVSDKEVNLAKRIIETRCGNICVIAGEADCCCKATIELVQILRNTGYNVELKVIPGMGHFLTEEAKKEIVRIFQ